jgi:hypothetical protein
MNGPENCANEPGNSRRVPENCTHDSGNFANCPVNSYHVSGNPYGAFPDFLNEKGHVLCLTKMLRGLVLKREGRPSMILSAKRGRGLNV